MSRSATLSRVIANLRKTLGLEPFSNAVHHTLVRKCGGHRLRSRRPRAEPIRLSFHTAKTRTGPLRPRPAAGEFVKLRLLPPVSELGDMGFWQAQARNGPSYNARQPAIALTELF